MSNSSQEEESQGSIHLQTLQGDWEQGAVKGDTAVPPTTVKRRRNLPGNPDPDAEVVALSPRTLLATNRYVCEVCHKGFQRDQNLQLHRRGHNLPWKLKQRATTEVKKKVYICPETTCAHHDPSRALGDLTGIKKHFSRKHGEKKWKCDKCSKRYAVQSDWKAHVKICGAKEYRCDCGTIFSRKDSFVTHRAFCDALVEQNYRVNQGLAAMVGNLRGQATNEQLHPSNPSSNTCTNTDTVMVNTPFMNRSTNNPLKSLSLDSFIPSNSNAALRPCVSKAAGLQVGGSSMAEFGGEANPMATGSMYMSATALLQKAAEMGSKVSSDSISPILFKGFNGYSTSTRSVGTMQNYSNDHAIMTASRGFEAPVNGLALHNGGLVSAESSSLYTINQNEFGMNMKWDGNNTDLSPTSTFLHGVRPSSIMQDHNRDSTVFLETEMQKCAHEVAEGGEVRMTQDFLRLGPVENLIPSIGDQDHQEHTLELRHYSAQPNPHEVDSRSYGHSSQEHNALEKPMWEF